MQSSECREALGARCVALVGAKSRVADDVWHTPAASSRPFITVLLRALGDLWRRF
jgi:hypothetical protein